MVQELDEAAKGGGGGGDNAADHRLEKILPDYQVILLVLQEVKGRDLGDLSNLCC